MNIWHNISPKRINKDDFIAVIEIEKGGKCKYELDKETGILILDRILYTSTRSFGCSGALLGAVVSHDLGALLPHRGDYHD